MRGRLFVLAVLSFVFCGVMAGAPMSADKITAVADAIDARDRKPIFSPDRRDQEIEALLAEVRRLRVQIELAQERRAGCDR